MVGPLVVADMGNGAGLSEETSPFLSLPEALQLTIIEKVDPFSLGRLSCSCHQLQSLVSLERHPAVVQLWERYDSKVLHSLVSFKAQDSN
jgi:hypothetical protein